MGKQTVIEEESVKQHLRSPHSVESAPTATYTPATQNASHRGSNIATKQVRFNHVGNMPLQKMTHIGYDKHALDAPPNIHFRQNPHFEYYDPHGRAFDRNYKQPNPHGRLFDGNHRQPPRYANNEHVDITRKCSHHALALEQSYEDEHESEHNSSDYEKEIVGPIDCSGDDELNIDDEHVNVRCVMSTIVDDD
ncbi:hypothetical protein GH714_013738 [Hevea brasiliensis]|uniref:Uncharacterized protein n=1 Tax=Hevea brasiliensis TaxID=3981 RepID=A0A6A6M4Z3_HEVBR|nr:hypothetical protein GH714_013738 [Hevea brasiliensis]